MRSSSGPRTAAERRADAERTKVVAADLLDEHAIDSLPMLTPPTFRSARTCRSVPAPPPRASPRNIGTENTWRAPGAPLIASRGVDHDEFARPLHRKRAQQQLIGQREDRGVGADAERQREDGSDGEGGAAAACARRSARPAGDRGAQSRSPSWREGIGACACRSGARCCANTLPSRKSASARRVASSSDAPPATSSRQRSSRCCDSSSTISCSRAGESRSDDSRARRSSAQSGMFVSRHRRTASTNAAPGLPLLCEDALPPQASPCRTGGGVRRASRPRCP